MSGTRARAVLRRLAGPRRPVASVMMDMAIEDRRGTRRREEGSSWRPEPGCCGSSSTKQRHWVPLPSYTVVRGKPSWAQYRGTPQIPTRVNHLENRKTTPEKAQRSIRPRFLIVCSKRWKNKIHCYICAMYRSRIFDIPLANITLHRGFATACRLFT